ncbi:hypothetical protein QUF80_06140 [Desulfococcaceae bacterium HSG8]|nr:hypothetical protein [Desulfococcaceae bacterium HSG8]
MTKRLLFSLPEQGGCSRGIGKSPALTGFGFANPNRAVLKALMLLAALVARGFNDARGGLTNPPPSQVRICQSEPSGFKGSRF